MTTTQTPTDEQIIALAYRLFAAAGGRHSGTMRSVEIDRVNNNTTVKILGPMRGPSRSVLAELRYVEETAVDFRLHGPLGALQ